MRARASWSRGCAGGFPGRVSVWPLSRPRTWPSTPRSPPTAPRSDGHDQQDPDDGQRNEDLPARNGLNALDAVYNQVCCEAPLSIFSPKTGISKGSSPGGLSPDQSRYGGPSACQQQAAAVRWFHDRPTAWRDRPWSPLRHNPPMPAASWQMCFRLYTLYDHFYALPVAGRYCGTGVIAQARDVIEEARDRACHWNCGSGMLGLVGKPGCRKSATGAAGPADETCRRGSHAIPFGKRLLSRTVAGDCYHAKRLWGA